MIVEYNLLMELHHKACNADENKLICLSTKLEKDIEMKAPVTVRSKVYGDTYTYDYDLKYAKGTCLTQAHTALKDGRSDFKCWIAVKEDDGSTRMIPAAGDIFELLWRQAIADGGEEIISNGKMPLYYK